MAGCDKELNLSFAEIFNLFEGEQRALLSEDFWPHPNDVRRPLALRSRFQAVADYEWISPESVRMSPMSMMLISYQYIL